MRDRRLLLASRQGVELLRYSGLRCGGRSQGAVGDRPSGGRRVASRLWRRTALQKVEGRDARVSAALKRSKKTSIGILLV